MESINTAADDERAQSEDDSTAENGEPLSPQELRIVELAQLPTRTPPPHFSKLARSTHYITVLVEVWLFVASMYTRENLFSDASAAVDEAQKLIELLQAETATVESSGRAWLSRGWGMGKSISRLLADVWAQRGHVAHITSGPFKAQQCFERSLLWHQDHPSSTPALAKMLFDMYDEILPIEPPPDNYDALLHSPPSAPLSAKESSPAVPKKNLNAPPSPDELNRIACRDRGYSLVAALTKLGESWDDPEAWFLLGRAGESEGLVDRAAECFWWVVELEDSKPVRHWRVVGIMV